MLSRVSHNQYKRVTRRKVKGSNQYVSRYAQRKFERQMKAFFTFVALLVMFGYVGSVYAQEHFTPEIVSPLPKNPIVQQKVAGASAKPQEDQRVIKLRSYLESKNSPLTKYADHIVSEADRTDIPWTLVVAIAGKESSFGKAIKPESYNAWGVMGWSNGVRHIRIFSDWKEAITFESELLSNNYRVNMNAAIQAKYCPSFECSSTWTAHVTQFQKEINL